MNIDSIVKNNFCTGCGVCISEDDNNEAKMIWNEDGFLVPKLGINSTQDKMVNVCPFYKNQKNEDVLGELFLRNNSENYHSKVGYYTNLYAGYAKQYRKTSSSGGMATYIFKKLLEEKIVDYLFVVKEKNGEYSYQFFSDFQDIKKISKTRYVPVTMTELFEKISTIDGKVAVSGVACFVKAIRLKQYYYPELKEKIPFIVGIICGGLKSKLYTDYLAQAADCYTDYESAQYRIKNEKAHALDYSFSCINKKEGRIHTIEMNKLGDMWGTGLFKSNACDFCDDVVTELADISLGDAWINPYNQSGLGNSIVITRSLLADKIISTGINLDELKLDKLDKSRTIQSQSGSFNHRHKGLYFRINAARKCGLIVPNKRERFLNPQNFIFNLVQMARSETRSKSLDIWKRNSNITDFNSKMILYLEKLKFLTKLNQYFNRLIKLFSKADTK